MNGSAPRCSRILPSADVAARWWRWRAKPPMPTTKPQPRGLVKLLHQMRGGNSGGWSGFQLRLWRLLPRHRSLFISSARTGMDQTSTLQSKIQRRVQRRLQRMRPRSRRRSSLPLPPLPRPRRRTPQSMRTPPHPSNCPRRRRLWLPRKCLQSPKPQSREPLHLE